MKTHEHFHFDEREPVSAFVPCDIVVYFPTGHVASFDAPSFCVWIVPGTVSC